MVGGATHAKFSCLLNVDFAFKRGGVVDSFYYFFLGTKQQLYKKLGEKRWMDFTKSGVPTGKGGGKGDSQHATPKILLFQILPFLFP